MPGRDILGSMEDPSPNFALFKSHKTLPRSNTQTDDRRLSYPTEQTPIQVHGVEGLSARSSERIRSWIQEPFSAHAAVDREFPPTPPIISLDLKDEDWMDDPALTNYLAVASRVSPEDEVNTPLVQQSPPTPETTPPRATNAIDSSLAPRDPSLRTGSFETAREHPSSDGEETSINSPSLHPARQRWLKNPGKAKLKSIGLGLGLESDDEEKPTSARTALNQSPETDELKPSSGPRQRLRVEDESNDAGLKDEHSADIFLQQKMIRTRPRMSTHPRPRSGKIGEGAGSPVIRSQSLRQRLEKAQHHPSPSMENFAEKIDWPLDDEELDLDAKLREVDNRRFSQISATSTVVEAMVIDNTPRRKQTLRHTGKVSDFKSGSPQANTSNSSVIMLDSKSRRRLPRHSYSPDRGRRRSVATDVSGNAASALTKAQHGVIPKKSRPRTAPQETVGYFDIPHREHRTLSAAAETWMSKPGESVFEDDLTDTNRPEVLVTPANEERLEIIAAPPINGATTAGLPQAVLHLSDPSDIYGVNLDRARSGEWSAFRPRSALFTPFSMRSAHSSTPGTLEVNEATAISIYPHTNKSILVIQETAGSGSTETSAIIAGNANIALPMSITPAMAEPLPERLNSPLQNPREPPKPPDLKLIPPTPFNGPRTPEADPHHSQLNSKNRLSGTISVVKRALSTRRYSEPSILSRGQSLARDRTVPGPHRSGLGNAQDHNLHPFWRPRGFWDGLSDDSDSDSEFGNSGVLVGNSLLVAPKPQPPESLPSGLSPTRQLARSASLSHRLTSSLGLSKKGKPHMRSWTEHWYRTPSGDLVPHNSTSLNRTRELAQPVGSKPTERGLHEHRLPFVGFKALAQRLEKALNQREEGKREKVRERLRGSIDVIRGDGIGVPSSF